MEQERGLMQRRKSERLREICDVLYVPDPELSRSNLARFDHRKTDVWDDCQTCTVHLTGEGVCMFVLDAVIDCSINRAQEGPQNLLLVQNKRVKKVVESQAPEIFSLLNVRTCAETQAQH